MDKKNRRKAFYIFYLLACVLILFNLETVLKSWCSVYDINSIDTIYKTMFLIFVLCIPLWIASDLKNKDE